MNVRKFSIDMTQYTRMHTCMHTCPYAPGACTFVSEIRLLVSSSQVFVTCASVGRQILTHTNCACAKYISLTNAIYVCAYPSSAVPRNIHNTHRTPVVPVRSSKKIASCRRLTLSGGFLPTTECTQEAITHIVQYFRRCTYVRIYCKGRLSAHMWCPCTHWHQLGSRRECM